MAVNNYFIAKEKKRVKIVRISSDFLQVYFCLSLIPLNDNNILFYVNYNSLSIVVYCTCHLEQILLMLYNL